MHHHQRCDQHADARHLHRDARWNRPVPIREVLPRTAVWRHVEAQLIRYDGTWRVRWVITPCREIIHVATPRSTLVVSDRKVGRPA
jgi:hypothetical protein